MNYIENAVALRRELHQIPELGWGEFCTTARIIEELDRLTTNLKRRPSRHRLLPERVTIPSHIRSNHDGYRNE